MKRKKIDNEIFKVLAEQQVDKLIEAPRMVFSEPYGIQKVKDIIFGIDDDLGEFGNMTIDYLANIQNYRWNKKAKTSSPLLNAVNRERDAREVGQAVERFFLAPMQNIGSSCEDVFALTQEWVRNGWLKEEFKKCLPEDYKYVPAYLVYFYVQEKLINENHESQWEPIRTYFYRTFAQHLIELGTQAVGIKEDTAFMERELKEITQRLLHKKASKKDALDWQHHMMCLQQDRVINEEMERLIRSGVVAWELAHTSNYMIENVGKLRYKIKDDASIDLEQSLQTMMTITNAWIYKSNREAVKKLQNTELRKQLLGLTKEDFIKYINRLEEIGPGDNAIDNGLGKD